MEEDDLDFLDDLPADADNYEVQEVNEDDDCGDACKI